MKLRFPISKPNPVGNERLYLEAVLCSDRWSGGAEFTLRCEDFLSRTIGNCSALLVPSGTAALEMATLVLGLGPGDEVIMPSFTFSSCANAVVLRGATPVFVDIRPDTLNLDESKILEAITPRTRAIMPVHYAGICCEMDTINDIAAKASIAVIEDAAQAYLSTYRGRPAGTLGSAAAISFHETKNVGCGEGGAFSTTSFDLGKAAEIVRDKGTNRSQFFRGEVDKYSWIEIGSSYVVSEFQAAVLLAQLEQANSITAHRLWLWNRYFESLASLEERGLISRPRVPAECSNNAHIFRIMLANEEHRDAIIAQLRADGIGAAFHFVPLHSSQAGKRWGRSIGPMSVTTDASKRLLRLPLYADLKEDDVDFIVGRVIHAIEASTRN